MAAAPQNRSYSGGITMGIGAFVALVGFSRAFEHEWMRLYSSAGTDIAVVETNFINTFIESVAWLENQGRSRC